MKTFTSSESYKMETAPPRGLQLLVHHTHLGSHSPKMSAKICKLDTFVKQFFFSLNLRHKYVKLED